MENELISIIIPCYNASRYLDDVFEGLKSQTYQKFEAVFVDDGSTDDTFQKIETFCRNFTKAKLLRKNNGGQASARNFAMKSIIGKYILFLDADDSIESHALETLHHYMKINDADCVIGKFKNVKENFSYPIQKNNSSASLKTKIYISSDKLVSQYLSCNIFRPEICNKLYLHSIIKKMPDYPNVFSEKRRYMEDVLFQVRYFSLSNKAVYISYPFYYYRHTKDSTTHVMFKESMLTIFDGNEFYPFLDPNLFVESQIYINAKYATDNLELLFRISNSNYSNPPLVREMYAHYKRYLKYCFRAKRSQWYRKYLMWMSRPFLYLIVRKKMK